VETFVDGVSNGATSGSGNFNSSQATLQINTATTQNDWSGAADEVFIVHKALDAARISRIISGSIPGDFVDCDSFTAANYATCDTNDDCGAGAQICDTDSDATNDTYCVEGAYAGCCMGYNSSRAGTSPAYGAAMTACNTIP
jgi:hypothetical protein